jgi:hypothetical protein
LWELGGGVLGSNCNFDGKTAKNGEKTKKKWLYLSSPRGTRLKSSPYLNDRFVEPKLINQIETTPTGLGIRI